MKRLNNESLKKKVHSKEGSMINVNIILHANRWKIIIFIKKCEV